MRLRPLLTSVLLALLLLPASAHAFSFPNSYTQLLGLDEANGEWVREYGTSLANPSTIYAATEGDGVFRSTSFGVSWSAFNSGLSAQHGDFNVRAVLAGASSVLIGTEGGVFRSTGGAWQPLGQGEDPNPQQPTKLNRSVQSLLSPAGGPLLAGVFNGGVWRSGDGGQTWAPPAPGNGMPSNETVWSLATLTQNLVYAATSSGLYASLDFGTTWTPVGDGVTGTTLRVFADDDNPNIYYAGTTDGFFRSVTAGLTWTKENGPPGHAIGQLPVRSIQQKAGVDETRIYAATNSGLYAGKTANNTTGGFLPGPISWRKVIPDDAGLNGHTILWAVSSFLNGAPAGTFLVGTQGGGGFGLTMTPPSNTAAPVLSDTTPAVGQTITTTSGTWSGSKTIEYEYAWQDCGTGASASCPNVTTGATIDGEDGSALVVKSALQGHWIRSVVTATNDFPTFGLVKKESATTTAKVAAAANTVPGFNTGTAPNTPAVLDPAPSTSFAWPGSRLRVPDNSWVINPCTQCTISFSWTRCDSADLSDPSCETLRTAGGALVTAQEITLTTADIGKRFCARVRATSPNGDFESGCSGFTNVVFPRQPAVVKAPFVEGTPVVGASLTGNAGLWDPAPVSYKRRWQQCDATGGSCVTLSNQSKATYTPTTDDVGRTLRVVVTVDANGDNVFPGPVEETSAPSAVVTLPPAPAPPAGGGSGGGGGGGGPLPGGPDTVRPTLGTVKASSSVKAGSPLALTLAVSEPGRLQVVLQRLVPGSRKGKRCVPGRRRGAKRCTATRTVKTQTLPVTTTQATLKVATTAKGKRLARGRYRAVLTPIDAAGNAGAPKVVSFRLR